MLFIQAFEDTGPCIVEMLNTLLLTGGVPSFIKHAAVKPALKKLSLVQLEPKNYRPISKLPFMSNILEKVVAKLLTIFLENQELFDKCQPTPGNTVLVLLDLSSDFDTI